MSIDEIALLYHSEGRRNEDGRGRLKSPLLRLPSSFLRPNQSVYGYMSSLAQNLVQKGYWLSFRKR
jgi:hypothetical protein